MKFKEYPSIEYLTENTIALCREAGLDKVPWCVTGKLDGSNMQVAIDVDDSIHYGGRNHELGRYDEYNGWRRAAENQKIEERVRKLKANLDQYWMIDILNDGPYVLIVFFELIGGVYRHRDVVPVKEACKIQGRVQYHPDNVMVAIDMFWYQPSTKDSGWFAPQTIDLYCAQVGIPHRQILATLPFDEAIKYPNDYLDTTAHDLFGLPQIEDNIAEGVVIMPKLPQKFKNGARVIFKNKNTIFKERGVKTNKIKNPPTPMSELDKEWYATYMEFVTESRMMSVLSKMDTSHITQKDFGVLLKAFLDDADKDFNKEYGGTIKELEGSKTLEEFNFMKVLKAAKGQAAQMLRPMFVEFLQKNRMESTNG